MTQGLSAQDSMKRSAAMRAAEEVEDGMVVGLGSGTTAVFVVAALAARVARGLRMLGIPTSNRTAALAKQLGLGLTTFATHSRIDIVIDGADQVTRDTLDMIKGLGGALLREKIVASAAARVVVAIDESKLVDRLGGVIPLPVEIVAFGRQSIVDRLAAAGCAPRLRLVEDRPFVTDGGNCIVDCALGDIADPRSMQSRLKEIVGVVETGLFVGMADKIMVGRPGGVEVLEK